MTNLCTKGTVRKRPIKNGQTSLYLDFYPPIRNPKTDRLSRREYLGLLDHDTGKSFKLNAEDMSAIQDLVAETLDMQRGQKKSETGIDHLERNDFIIQKQENKKKQLQEEVNKAAAEKEEVEAEVEAAKTEVADLWKEHDYLTSANRTKAERSNRLDLDIRNKTNRSQALDDAIDAKKQEVAGLTAKADEKLLLYDIAVR